MTAAFYLVFSESSSFLVTDNKSQRYYTLFIWCVYLCSVGFCEILINIEVFVRFNIRLYYIWCGFRTISLAKSVTWYTEYVMHFFSLWRNQTSGFYFTYIDAMLLNLEAPVPQQTKLFFVNLSVFKNFIKFQNSK